jgi:hypothetical protein
MAMVNIAKLHVWCNACADFHSLRQCKAVSGKGGGIGYLCPNAPADEPEPLMWQAAEKGGAA